MSEHETIVHPQREISGAIYHERDCVGLKMIEGGNAVAEIWITAGNLDEVIGWLEFARDCLDAAEARGPW